MAKTNLDDLDQAQPGIEADEVNSEAATAGQVMTADGAGGADFSDAVLQIGEHYGMRSSNAAAFDTTDYNEWRGVMIGHDARFQGNGAVALGYNARATGLGAVAIGYQADVGDGQSVGIGYVQVTGAYAVAVGNMAAAPAQCVAIGNYSGVDSGVRAVAVGDHAWIEADKGVAIGAYTFVQSDSGVAVGHGAQAGAAKAVALGPGVENGAADSVRIGWGNTAGDYMHMGSFTPVAGTPAASHFIPVTLNGSAYKILLSNV